MHTRRTFLGLIGGAVAAVVGGLGLATKSKPPMSFKGVPLKWVPPLKDDHQVVAYDLGAGKPYEKTLLLTRDGIVELIAERRNQWVQQEADRLEAALWSKP